MQETAKESKIGFWSLFSIVVGAQLGASIFLLPSELARFRTLGIIGWVIAGFGAILLTTVLSFLCVKTTKSGGPHIYAKMFFGPKVGFFLAWIYWCGSWACNPILISTAVNYLQSFLDITFSKEVTLFIEIMMVLFLTVLTTSGAKNTGQFEIFLSCIKIIPLFIIPIVAFSNIEVSNFREIMPQNMSTIQTLSGATILSCWGYVGLEGGTTPSGCVKNQKRTIPLAIILGTSFVAIISVVNTIAIFGIIPPNQLESIGAPFAKVMTIIFGQTSEKFLGIMAFIMCYGSLNAWIFFSGQIARSSANEGLFPAIFKKANKRGAPSNAIWIGTIGTVTILTIRKYTEFASAIGSFINMSVMIYIILYIFSVAAYAKYLTLIKSRSFKYWSITLLALLFCLYILLKANLQDFSAVLIAILTGIPLYIKYRKNKQ